MTCKHFLSNLKKEYFDNKNKKIRTISNEHYVHVENVEDAEDAFNQESSLNDFQYISIFSFNKIIENIKNLQKEIDSLSKHIPNLHPDVVNKMKKEFEILENIKNQTFK